MKDFSRLGRRYWLWLSDEIEQNYFLFAPKIKRTLTLSKNIIKLYQIKNKTKNNISRKHDHQNSDLIQARKHVLAKLNASAILNRPSWQPVIQRLEIYGLFTDVVVVVVFCASNVRTQHHPSTSNFSFAAKQGQPFCPGKILSRYTHKFLRCEFRAEMSGNRSRFWKQAKIDWNFILSIKFVKRAKSTLFKFKFKLAFQKKTFRSKSII